MPLLGGGIFGELLPDSGMGLIDPDIDDCLPLFLQSRRMLFTLMIDEELFCDPDLAASSEVTESNENLLDGVCECVRWLLPTLDCASVNDEVRSGGLTMGSCCDTTTEPF